MPAVGLLPADESARPRLAARCVGPSLWMEQDTSTVADECRILSNLSRGPANPDFRTRAYIQSGDDAVLGSEGYYMSDIQPDIPGSVTYTRYDTKAGDSADSISRKFGVPWPKIWEASQNDNFRTELGRFLGRSQGRPGVVVIPDTAPKMIPAGLVLWIPTGKVDFVHPPAVGKPYVADLPFRRETLASKLLNPAQSGSASFELRIILPLYVNGVVPTASTVTLDKRPIAVRSWTAAELERFKQDVKRKAEGFWNRRFRLWAPDGYTHLRWPAGSTKAAGVDCTLEIRYSSASGPDSLTINAYKRSLMEAGTTVEFYDRMNSFTWTDRILEDQRDITAPDDTGANVTTSNNTIAHEVGHLLQLGHSNGNGENLDDYGWGSQRWKILNIMGMGSLVNRTNAVPWLRHIFWHTGIEPKQWTVHTLDKSGNPEFL